MKRYLLIPALLLALGGCATRGTIDFTCNGLDKVTGPLPESALEQEIHRDAHVWPGHVAAGGAVVASKAGEADGDAALLADPLGAAMLGLVEQGNPPPGTGLVPMVAERRASRPVLLLSGGGQWGAFGAGLLDRLNLSDGPGATDFGVITGVSTGAVQSLFVAINDRAAYDALIRAYSPKAETEVVNRPQRKELAAITGALAGLAPLRTRIEEALCTEGDPAKGCPLIEALAGSNRPVFIGFIKASTGEFLYADASAIARQVKDDPRNAQQCLTGIAMASAAMPAFYQQVQINQETYFDGGVRKSVFVAGIASLLEKAVRVAEWREAKAAVLEKRRVRPIATPPLYVIRNGPTQLLGPDGKPAPDPDSNKRLNALDAALRAEAIVVNEMEVGSIAALRLVYPRGTIRLATADGYHMWPRPDGTKGCAKPKDVMFDPDFMQCLQSLGRTKADWPSPWIELGELPMAPAADPLAGGP